MPVLSIIVPIYNAKETLSRCVNSILSQDFKDFELLLMDDGSKDGSEKLCDSFCEKDARIRVIHKENSGVSNTRNAALSIAKGRYIQFLDADDWITPEASGQLVRALEKEKADIVIADFYRVVEKWISRKGSIDKEGLLTRQEFADWMAKSPADYYYGVLWNKLFRRDIIERYGLRMDPELRWCEDFIFNMEYLLHADRIYVLRVPIYYYVKTEGSLVQQGLNASDIIRMKLNVIDYYSDFYKNVYSPEDYAKKRAEIYRFLLDYSRDNEAIPPLPGSKKLGEERTKVAHDFVRENSWTKHYYEERMFQRLFRSVMSRFDLERRELSVLLYLHSFGSVGDLKELSEYLELPKISAQALLQYLSIRGYLKMDFAKPETASLTEKSGRILNAIDSAVSEEEQNSTEGMSEGEKKNYRALREKVFQNLKKRLRM